LAFLLVRLSGFHLDSRRVPDGAAKRSILDAVAHATKAIPLAVALRVLRLSAASYHEWSKRPRDCSLDGTRTHLRAVIDNFSRRILARSLAPRLESQNTCLVLAEAARNLPKKSDGTTVIADSGIENVHGEVDGLFGLGQLHCILAQVEVSYSNSMIEALWRSISDSSVLSGVLQMHEERSAMS
jgi:transposase InsO family protein